MVSYGQLIAKIVLEHGSVFHLQVDGWKHVYQVEVGLSWKFPVVPQPVHADLDKGG